MTRERSLERTRTRIGGAAPPASSTCPLHARRPISTVALVLLVAACAAPARPPVVRPPALPARRAAPGATVLLLDVAPDDAVAIPRLVARNDATIDYVVGGVRVEAGDRRVVTGDERFAAPIVRVGHVRDGWYFIAADGTVAVSETFLGPLRRILHTTGVSPRRASPRTIAATEPTPPMSSVSADVAMLGVGRVGFVDAAGRAYTATSVNELHPLVAPAVDALAEIGFGDIDHGTVLLVTGRAMTTVDGGATWHLPEHGQWSPSDVTMTGYTNELTTLVQRIGSPARVVFAGEWRRLARDPRRFDELGGVVLSDGSVMMFDGRDRVVFDDQGVERDREREGFGWVDGHAHVPGRPAWSGGCTPGGPASRSIGRLLLRTSRDGHGEERSWDGGRSFAPVRAGVLASFTDTLLAGDDSLAARRYACDLDGDRRDAMCVLAAGESNVHEIVIPADLEPLAVEAHHVLAVGPHRRPAWIGFDGGHDVAFPDAMRGVFEAAPVADGSVVMVLVDAARRAWLASAAGDTIDVRTMPPHTVHVAFADRMRGLAWGAHAGTVFRTRDGARSWEPVPVDVDGDPAAIALGGPAASGDTLARCSAHRCIAGGRVLVIGWDEFASAREHSADAPLAALAPAVVPAYAHANAARWPAPGALGPYTCAVSQVHALPPFPVVPRVALVRTLLGPRGEVRLAFGADDINGSTRIAWRASDAQGDFVADAQRTPSPVWQAVAEQGDEPDEPVPGVILALDRAHALLSISMERSMHHVVVDAPAGGPLRSEQGHNFDPGALVVGANVLTVASWWPEQFELQRVFGANAQPDVSPRSPVPDQTFVAVHDDRVGVVLPTSTEAGARVFHDIASGEMRLVRGFDTTRIGVCPTTPDPRALFVRLAPARHDLTLAVGHATATAMTVEITFGEGAPCVRAVEGRLSSGAFRVEATDGVLAGVRYTSGTTATLRCAP